MILPVFDLLHVREVVQILLSVAFIQEAVVSRVYKTLHICLIFIFELLWVNAILFEKDNSLEVVGIINPTESPLVAQLRNELVSMFSSNALVKDHVGEV